MQTRLITHPACLEHDPGRWHPECPDRLRAVLAALEGPAFAALDRAEATPASAEALGRVHDPAYVEAILRIRPDPGSYAQLDPDTLMSAGSAEAALLAAGAAMDAVDVVLNGTAEAAFAAIRPPGHHAEAALAYGFCLFNNVAIAARHARARWGLRRVAVVDFDVHHGNGTQADFAPDPDLFYASSHQAPLFPGTGLVGEHGVAGNIVNAPLPAGTDGAGFRAAWARRILPALADFAPELLIVSAGFDAHRADPLAQLELEDADFAWITAALVEAAGGRIVSVLEGGYDLAALGSAAAAHVGVLLRA